MQICLYVSLEHAHTGLNDLDLDLVSPLPILNPSKIDNRYNSVKLELFDFSKEEYVKASWQL